MRKFIFIILFILTAFTLKGQVITIGPMLHCYFPNGKAKLTFGVEAAIYFLLIPIPYLQSIDIGIEAGKDVNFIYSEFQLTKPDENLNHFTGLSFGIFRRSDFENQQVIGFQSTVWTTNFVGVDIRLRLSNKYKDIGIGTFGKLIIPFVPLGT